GDGTLRSIKYFTTAFGPSWVEIADLNRDGIPDLAVSSNSGSAAGTTLAVTTLLGVGDGTFRSMTRVEIPSGPNGIAAGDLDGDGRVDLVVEGQPTTIFWGRGDGSFQVSELPYSQSAGLYPVLADVNGDGKPDIVTTGLGALSVRLNTGSRGFQPL